MTDNIKEFLAKLKALCAEYSCEISVTKDRELMVSSYSEDRKEWSNNYYLLGCSINADTKDVQEFRKVEI